VEILQHGPGLSWRQGAKVLFDDFSRSSDSRIRLWFFDAHSNHRITASEGHGNAAPKRLPRGRRKIESGNWKAEGGR
jgi:hypothetical protein